MCNRLPYVCAYMYIMVKCVCLIMFYVHTNLRPKCLDAFMRMYTVYLCVNDNVGIDVVIHVMFRTQKIWNASYPCIVILTGQPPK